MVREVRLSGLEKRELKTVNQFLAGKTPEPPLTRQLETYAQISDPSLNREFAPLGDPEGRGGIYVHHPRGLIVIKNKGSLKYARNTAIHFEDVQPGREYTIVKLFEEQEKQKSFYKTMYDATIGKVKSLFKYSKRNPKEA